MNIAPIGVGLLGAVLGYLTHYLVRRDEKPGIEDLGSIAGMLLTGVVIKVVTPENSPADQIYWYMFGVGIGFFLYWLALMLGRERGEAASSATKEITRSIESGTKSTRSIQGGEDAPGLSDHAGRRRLTLFPFLR